MLFEEIIKLLFSFIIGAIIGNEREKHHKPVGMRTICLLCLSSTLIMIVIQRVSPVEIPRVIAGIITGIGFLGAGAIIAEGKTIKGLTTAVLTWSMAIIGITIGLGEFTLAFISSVMIYVILVMRELEDKSK